MIHESASNMALQQTLASPPWTQALPNQKKALIAIRKGDIGLLSQALSEGAEISSGRRPLLIEAARCGNSAISLYLLGRGASVTFSNIYGETAAHAAAQIGEMDLLRLLIGAGANVNAADLTGATPIMQAAFHGHLQSVALLTQYGAKLNVRDQDGVSVLAHTRNGRAALEWKRRRSFRQARDLIATGKMAPNEWNDFVVQDFEWARSVQEQYRSIRKYLISKGATQCKTPVELLSLRKRLPTIRHAA